MSRFVYLVCILCTLCLTPAFASVQVEPETHPVRILVTSHVPNTEAQALYIPYPPGGLDLEEWTRRVNSAVPTHVTIPRGVETEIQLPAGVWLIWAKADLCNTTSKRMVRMPRSKPEFAVRFWLADDPGMQGRVVDAKGNGIPGATIKLFRWDTSTSSVSKPGGKFDLPEAQWGRHSLSVEAEGFVPIEHRLIEVPRWGGMSGVRLLMKKEVPVEAPVKTPVVPNQKAIKVQGVYRGLEFEGQMTSSHHISEQCITLNWGLKFRHLGKEPWSAEADDEGDSVVAPVSEDGAFEVMLGQPGKYLVSLALGSDPKTFRYFSSTKPVELPPLPYSPFDSDNTAHSSPKKDEPKRNWMVIGIPRVVHIPDQPEVTLELEKPTGRVRLSLLGEAGMPLVPFRADDWKALGRSGRGPFLGLKSSEPWGSDILCYRMSDGTIGVEGLPPGRYTLAGSFGLGPALLYRRWVLPEPVEVDVESGTVDLEVILVQAVEISGVVLNPSHSLREVPGRQLAVFAWMDRGRTKALGHCRLQGGPKFLIDSLPRVPLFLSVEEFPEGAGFRGPVVEVKSLESFYSGYELLVP